jgi:hypothetical protein
MRRGFEVAEGKEVNLLALQQSVKKWSLRFGAANPALVVAHYGSTGCIGL